MDTFTRGRKGASRSFAVTVVSWVVAMRLPLPSGRPSPAADHCVITTCAVNYRAANRCAVNHSAIAHTGSTGKDEIVRVIIVGAGIGGLALAQGLRRAGAEVVVLERDTDLRRTGGYSLHLREPALDGLRDLIDASSLERLLALAQPRWHRNGYAVRDHRTRLLAMGTELSPDDRLVIDRITLRLLLVDGLEDALVLGAEVTGSVQNPDGRAAAVLADGTHVDGDLIIAADGVGSPITEGLAGAPTATPTALIGVAGRTPAAKVSTQAREIFEHRSSLAVGPGGTGLYVGHHPPIDQQVVSSFTTSPLNDQAQYIWGAIFLEWAQTALLREQSGAQLVSAVSEQLLNRQWRADLLDLVGAADPATVSSFRFHSSPHYPAGIAPWVAGPVTGIGDAVHAMPPTGGLGASTAIRDAHVLHHELREVRDGRKTIPVAVHDYHTRMRSYAAEAVKASMKPAAWIRGSGKPVGAVLARIGLPATGAVSWAVGATRQKADH